MTPGLFCEDLTRDRDTSPSHFKPHATKKKKKVLISIILSHVSLQPGNLLPSSD